MKAVMFHQHGGLENIEVTDIAVPEPRDHECLIKVAAVSLNGFDPMVLRGIPGLKTPLPMIPGADFAGEIVKLGNSVDTETWSVGDRVSANPSQSDGMMGETKWGACCEYVCVEEEYLLAVPDKVSFADAACLPTAYGAAFRMMTTRGQVKSGEKVLILGASGGVGTCCVQLAKAVGATVIACTSSNEKAKKLKTLGADWVINTTEQDYVKEIIARYGKPSTRHKGGGVDVIVNYTGGETWAKCFRALTLQGRLLTCGATAGYDPKTDIRYIWSFEFSIIGSNSWEKSDLVKLLDLVAEGRLKPCVDSEHSFEQYGQALQLLMDRKVVGKSIIVP
ncbi:MAG: zinc-binding dehydrogenase [Rhizobiaceae bacterium]